MSRFGCVHSGCYGRFTARDSPPSLPALHLREQLPAEEQVPRQVETALPVRSLHCEHRLPAVTVVVADPFAVLGIGERPEGIVVHALVPGFVRVAAPEVKGVDEGDEGLVVTPPEFLVGF